MPTRCPRPWSDEAGDDGCEYVVESEQVDLDVPGKRLAVPLCSVELFPVAGTEDDGVEAAESLMHCSDRLVHRIGVRDVGGDGRHPAAGDLGRARQVADR